LAALLLVGLQSGCVAAGSSSGRLTVRGTLTSNQGQPLANEELQLLLPAAYGLGGLDLVTHEPEDFGQHDQIFKTTTERNGAFLFDLGTRIYHINFWLIPPLGGFPRHPPTPFVLLRVTSMPGEYYAIQTRDGKFKVFTDRGDELTLDRARLSGLEAGKEGGSDDNGPWTVGVIDLQVER
jgi:hypothetical protein